MRTKFNLTDSGKQRKVLKKLKLNQDVLTNIGKKILTALRSTTENDAKIASGMQGYLGGVRALREELKPLGWKKHCDSNVELVLHDALNVQIMVSSGDSQTGKQLGPQPKTKNPKGGETELIVSDNRQFTQLTFFPELELKIHSRSKRIPTWVLLYCADPAKKEMRLELSFPSGVDHRTRRIVSWEERILLPPIKFNPTLDYTPDYDTEIEIDIKRKV